MAATTTDHRECIEPQKAQKNTEEYFFGGLSGNLIMHPENSNCCNYGVQPFAKLHYILKCSSVPSVVHTSSVV